MVGPSLKVVTTMSVGYDHIDLEAAKAHNVKIGYTPDVLTDATADLTVLLTLAAARRMKEVKLDLLQALTVINVSLQTGHACR